MKLICGDFKCDICFRYTSHIVQIRIVKDLFWPVISVVCTDCLTSKEFFYLDDDDVLKFNRVETTKIKELYFNSLHSSSLSKKLGIK